MGIKLNDGMDRYNEIKEMNKQARPSIGGPVFGIIFLVWFVASIFGMLKASQSGHGALVITLFGQYFFVFGILALVSGFKHGDTPFKVKRYASGKVVEEEGYTIYTSEGPKHVFDSDDEADENVAFEGEYTESIKMVKGSSFDKSCLIPAIPCMLVGICAVAAGLIIDYGTEDMNMLLEAIVPCLLCSVFAIVGTIFIIVGYKKQIYTNQHINYEITATLSDYETRWHHDSDRGTTKSFVPVWSFYYRGENYKVEDPVGRGHRRYKIGTQVKIHINPEDPRELYSNIKPFIMCYVMGIPFAIVGVTATYLSVVGYLVPLYVK